MTDDYATAFAALGAATLGESGGRPMSPRIHATWPGASVSAPAFPVVCSAADGDELMARLTTSPADVAILDIRMPPEPDGGLITAERLRAAHPDLGLLFLSH